MDRIERSENVLELIKGYANNLITDDELNEMADIELQELTTIDGKLTEHTIGDDWCHYSGMPSPKAYTSEPVIECSKDLDEEWARESI